MNVMSIRMRHTRGHTGNRRSHHALSAMNIIKDKKSGNLCLPHKVDEITGTYRGKQIFTPKIKSKKIDKHTKKVNTTEVPHPSKEIKSSKGIFGKIATSNRPKARSGMGGQAS